MSAPFTAQDEQFMRYALTLAQKAADQGEVPVGAIVVCQNEIIAEGFNTPISKNDPSAHAEMVALRAAGQIRQNYRLMDCRLYVTLEPCMMCIGAILHARLDQVIFGAFDPKTGAAGSVINLFEESRLNHHTKCVGGLLESECSLILKTFFQDRRRLQKEKKAQQRE